MVFTQAALQLTLSSKHSCSGHHVPALKPSGEILVCVDRGVKRSEEETDESISRTDTDISFQTELMEQSLSQTHTEI